MPGSFLLRHEALQEIEMSMHQHQKHCFILGAVHTAGAVVTYIGHGLAAALPEIAAAATYFHMGLRGDNRQRNERRPDQGTPASPTAPEPCEDALSGTANPAAADDSPGTLKDAG